MTLTLPGTLPGLLRRCSPVRLGIARAIVNDPAKWKGRENWSLDLEDATGRAHAAWWLENAGWAVPTELGIHGFRLLAGYRGEHERWPVHVYLGDGAFACASKPLTTPGRFLIVPALAALDPNDCRLLPDESRWADAEALRLVCLHVGGAA